MVGTGASSNMSVSCNLGSVITPKDKNAAFAELKDWEFEWLDPN